MRDLTSYFQKAFAKKEEWGEEDVFATVGSLGTAEFDWEPGDEKWASLFNDRETVASICSEVPLLFILDSFLEPGLDTERLVVCTVSTFDEVVSVELSALEQIFNDDIAYELDFSALTVMDLWWATV